MKMVTVVDEDIDIGDPVRVEWAMVTRWQPDTGHSDSLKSEGEFFGPFP